MMASNIEICNKYAINTQICINMHWQHNCFLFSKRCFSWQEMQIVDFLIQKTCKNMQKQYAKYATIYNSVCQKRYVCTYLCQNISNRSLRMVELVSGRLSSQRSWVRFPPSQTAHFSYFAYFACVH